jgi:hypothetical protein
MSIGKRLLAVGLAIVWLHVLFFVLAFVVAPLVSLALEALAP